ncbi:TorF family putative porin [Pseudomonas sp. BMS12]|uniref:TorF family putative porin n=1 Tax=Pseudomonas sp. BMS12 TaxID=1796033 RepID=UPI00083AADF6|nr:TorF family putative porin [Pseudomonas sp. BMS12]
MHIRTLLLGSLALLGCQGAQAYVMERELFNYDLRLATTPTRSMAQGLVQPNASSAFHGGLDATHTSGWYFGGWAPSMGVQEGSMPQLDLYAGVQRPLNGQLGYELGLIRYSHPGLTKLDYTQYYSGLTLLGSRFGFAFSDQPQRYDGNFLLDLALPRPLNLDVTLKYGGYRLNQPALIGGNTVQRFGDWSLNLSRQWAGSRLQFSYGDSSLSGADCAAYSGNNGQCESLLMLRAERPLF